MKEGSTQPVVEATDLKSMVPNPFFGRGYFVRAWRMRRLDERRLEATMEDPSHALALMLEHDGHTLTKAHGRWLRAPLSSCLGAGDALDALLGCPIVPDLHRISRQSPAPLQCTHMLDTARLGIFHLATGRPDRRCDVIIPDRMQGVQDIQLFVDGAADMRLTMSEDNRILSPAPYTGASMFQGLARWAQAHLEPYEYERIFMIQRAAFVAQGAIVDTAHYYHRPGPIFGPPEGTCFGSQPERYEQSVRNPSWRPELTRETALAFRYDDL